MNVKKIDQFCFNKPSPQQDMEGLTCLKSYLSLLVKGHSWWTAHNCCLNPNKNAGHLRVKSAFLVLKPCLLCVCICKTTIWHLLIWFNMAYMMNWYKMV